MWSYDLATADDDVLGTLNGYGSREDLESVLGKPAFDDAGDLVSAEALSMAYFLQDRSKVEGGNTVDPVNEAWEEQVFLETVQDGASLRPPRRRTEPQSHNKRSNHASESLM